MAQLISRRMILMAGGSGQQSTSFGSYGGVDRQPGIQDIVRAHVPSALSVNAYDGEAWLSVVPFTNVDVRPTWVPRGSGLPLPELNLRTYVGHGDRDKAEAGYYALTYLLCEPGARSVDDPTGCLDDGDIFTAWRQAKQRGYIPADDPAPYRVLIHIVHNGAFFDERRPVCRPRQGHG